MLNNEISLSVVITANNRSEQTYFSLKSWDNIAKINKKYIQIILVEDTKNINNKVDIQKLNNSIYTNLNIVYIYIKNKFWINPCLNYNIGFEYIKSDNVVLTNAETCIFGNIYTEIKNNLNKDNYLVFDVFEMGKEHRSNCNLNKKIWDECSDFNYNNILNFIIDKDVYWIQSKNRVKNFHFLTSIHKETLQKIKGFDLDFMFGIAYDDGIFIYDVINSGIKIVNLHHDDCKIVGLHQWHNIDESIVLANNADLYWFKLKYMEKKAKNIHFNDYDTFEKLLIEYNSTI